MPARPSLLVADLWRGYLCTAIVTCSKCPRVSVRGVRQSFVTLIFSISLFLPSFVHNQGGHLHQASLLPLCCHFLYMTDKCCVQVTFTAFLRVHYFFSVISFSNLRCFFFFLLVSLCRSSSSLLLCILASRQSSVSSSVTRTLKSLRLCFPTAGTKPSTSWPIPILSSSVPAALQFQSQS